MTFGWYLVTAAMLAAGYVAHTISDAVMAAYAIIVILGIFQFAISAAQVPMLPMVDTATSQVYGKGGAGLAFGAFGTAWAAGTIVGPMVIVLYLITQIHGELLSEFLQYLCSLDCKLLCETKNFSLNATTQRCQSVSNWSNF